MFNHYLGYQKEAWKEGYSDLSQDQKIAIVPQIVGEPMGSASLIGGCCVWTGAVAAHRRNIPQPQTARSTKGANLN